MVRASEGRLERICLVRTFARVDRMFASGVGSSCQGGLDWAWRSPTDETFAGFAVLSAASAWTACTAGISRLPEPGFCRPRCD
jgi:hypothetical protein